MNRLCTNGLLEKTLRLKAKYILIKEFSIFRLNIDSNL